MAKITDMSLAELESLVDDQKSRLSDLKKKQKTLQKDLDSVNRQIASLEGKAGRRRNQSSGKSFGKKKKVRRRRAKNAKPLKTHVIEVLKGKKKGLALQEIHDRVLTSGYTTTSKNFKNVLYQCLYHNKEFVHNARNGTYKLK